ncbi:MAG: hypothetical protein A2V86_16210 [Deltaproteobacteria bacterium RBG_16_49_23]|nr:MAG: hypothetical protein A2V86_16210 [Deltaproteobacteria bacterium RBG_16_49_23]
MRRIALLFTCVFTLLFFFASLSLAQIQVRMRAIHASDLGSSVDPSLRDLHKELGSLFSFTSYRLMREEMLNLAMNQPVLISAREGTIKFEATLVGLQKGAAEVRIRVTREGSQMLNTQVRLSPGRTVLVGGPRHLRGGVVIYALYARF